MYQITETKRHNNRNSMIAEIGTLSLKIQEKFEKDFQAGQDL